uniref:Receptor expression-enhancing protein n=1 Tax=Acrobeloides nanus TaxID=290746 RepID=A0A914D5R9_9BILA
MTVCPIDRKLIKMPLPPQIDKFIADFDKLLHEPGAVTNVLATIEAKTGVKRLHFAGGLFLVHALYLIFGRWAELLCNFIGFLYPAYISIKAIETAHKEDDTQWLTYWVVFALFSVVEFFSDVFVRYFPLYWLVKCIFLLWLHLPMTLGAQKIYNRFIRPFAVQHMSSIDRHLGAVTDSLDAARKAYEKNVKPQ